jgi:DegV family protein with EDD domain
MKKIGVVTDSSSGLSLAECQSLGVYNVPMPFLIDDREYYEETNITKDEFFKKLDNGSSFKTSQPLPEAVLQCWDNVLNECEQILYFPISSGLSSSYSTAMLLADDEKYKNKVFPVDHKKITGCHVKLLKDALSMISSGKSPEEIRQIIEGDKYKSCYVIQLDTLTYLAKGGRVNNATAFLGNLLSLKPILFSNGDNFNVISKARTFNAGKTMVLEAVKEFIDKELKCSDYSELKFFSIHARRREAAEEFVNDIQSFFSIKDEVEICELPLIIACHIGPGALACGCCRK